MHQCDDFILFIDEPRRGVWNRLLSGWETLPEVLKILAVNVRG